MLRAYPLTGAAGGGAGVVDAIGTDVVTPKNLLIQPAGGNVGIGTTLPITKLHVGGPEALQLRVQNTSNNKYWNIYSESFNNSGNLIFTPDSGIGGYIERGSGNYFSLSDARLKRDIVPLNGVLDRVLQLRPVSYRFQNQSEDSSRTYGLIAQEVEPLFPEVVGEHVGSKALAYSEFVPITIGAIQELNRKMESENTILRDEIKRRDAENAELKQTVSELKELVQAMNQKLDGGAR
jgi:hypothetical protein